MSVLAGFLAGGVVGVIVERLIGKPLDHLVLDRLRNAWALTRRKKLERDFSLNDNIIIIGGTALHVREFVHNGFERNSIATRIQDEIGEINSHLSNMLPSQEEIEEATAASRRILDDDPRMWNGTSLALVRADVSRDSVTEVSNLTLTFRENEYARHIAISQLWENLPLQQRRGLDGNQLRIVDPILSTSFGLNCTLETADGKIMLTKRSVLTYGSHDRWHISFNEGLSKLDRLPGSRIDLQHAFARGLREEIGLEEAQIENFQDRLKVHTLILDVDRYQWGLLAHLDLRDTEITSTAIQVGRNLGAAHDDWESSQIRFIRFTDSVDEVLTELTKANEWSAHGLLNLALSTVLRHPNRASEIRLALLNT